MSPDIGAVTFDLRQTVERLARPDGLELVVQMAHDLRSPLTSILALAEALERGASGPVTDVQREQLRLIYTAAMHLCATSTDVLEMARGSSAVHGTSARPFSVRRLLQAIQDIARPMCVGRKIELRCSGPAVDWRIGHESVLSRVLLNLVTNAIKVTDRGFVAIEARETAHDSSRVVWSVCDSGPGLTIEAQRALYHVFEAKRAADVARFNSAGLGLGICRKLVAAMDATLHLDARPGEGTRFHFEVEAPRADR